jgi:hypothetical protein
MNGLAAARLRVLRSTCSARGRGVLCDPIERCLDRAADRDAGALGGRAGAALSAAEASSSFSISRSIADVFAAGCATSHA